jgi:hypothetical protein
MPTRTEMPTAQGPAQQALPRANVGQNSPIAPTAPNGGVNPQDYIERVHTKAGWSPGAKSVETKGGVQDPALAQQMGEDYAFRRAAIMHQGELEREALTAQAQQSALEYKNADLESLRLQDKMARQDANARIAAEQYTKISDKIAKERDAIANKEVNPGRVFEGKQGAQILAALSSAVGAFGASLTHGPNFALGIVNKKVDDDIQAQREQIARGVNAKDNDLVRIKDKYNVSTEVAEKIYRQNALMHAQSLARKQAALVGGQQAQMQLAQLDKGIADDLAKNNAEMKSTLLGEVTTKEDAKYHMGGDTYRVNPMLKATHEAEKTLSEMSTEKSTIEHEGQAPGKQGAGKGGKESARIATQEATAESAIEDLDHMHSKMPKGYVLGEHAMLPRTDARIDLETSANAIIGKAVAASNGSVNEKEMGVFHEMLTDPRESVRNKGYEALRQAIATQRAALGRASERSRGVSGGVDEAIQSAAEEANQ